MRKEDSVTKEYMKQNTIFADAFNFFLYGGKQVIDPVRLRPQDSTEIGIIHHTEEKQEQPPEVSEFFQRTFRVRFKNSDTSDEKSSRNIRYNETPRAHKNWKD